MNFCTFTPFQNKSQYNIYCYLRTSCRDSSCCLSLGLWTNLIIVCCILGTAVMLYKRYMWKVLKYLKFYEVPTLKKRRKILSAIPSYIYISRYTLHHAMFLGYVSCCQTVDNTHFYYIETKNWLKTSKATCKLYVERK